MKKALLIDSNHPVLQETLIAAGIHCDLFWDKSQQELISLIPQYDAIVIRSKFKITKEIIDSAPGLKCIGRAGAGMENIDVAYAESKNIRCLHAPEGNADAVAEHAMGMLLMLLNNLKKADSEVRKGLWLRQENRGVELHGKTVGIIGYGNMGAAFAKRLSGFDCKIMVYDKYKKGFGNNSFIESSLEELQNECDFISLHIPYSSENHYFLSEDMLRKFKKNIYVINTSRGKCLDTSALVNAMKSGRVTGACLDVLEYESVSFENIDSSQFPEPMQYLIQSDKTVLSPHIAGWTHESNYKISKILAEKIIKVLNA